jgi:hypothetical protein
VQQVVQSAVQPDYLSLIGLVEPLAVFGYHDGHQMAVVGYQMAVVGYYCRCIAATEWRRQLVR